MLATLYNLRSQSGDRGEPLEFTDEARDAGRLPDELRDVKIQQLPELAARGAERCADGFRP